MKLYLLPFLLLLSSPVLPAQQNGIVQNSECLTIPTGEHFLRWSGKLGRRYFVQIADPNAPLLKWRWAPIIESGNDEEMSYEVDGTAEKGFFRLKYTDQPLDPGKTLDTYDFDQDGLSNIDEIYPPPPLSASAATDPLDNDTDHDGMQDGFERTYGFDPNNADENGNGIPDGADDNDGDGRSNAAEGAAGTDPNDSEDTAVAEWFVLTVDSGEGVTKTETRTFTIKKGDSRVLVIGTTSEEYPIYTEPSSEFDDTLCWEILPGEGTEISETIHVNDRHDVWDIDSIDGVTLQGFSPVHIEKVKVILAPVNSPAIVTVTLKATNVSDGLLPSTVIVGLLPIRISPDDGMSGVLGDKVESCKGDGGEKHFVTPKKSADIAEDFVKLKAKGLNDAWLTPGDPNQLVEWDPGVGETNGDIRKWKMESETGRHRKIPSEDTHHRQIWE